MRILVTGANGYLGHWVVKELLKKGCSVVAADKANGRIPDGAQYIPLDILNCSSEDMDALGPIDALLHLAWQDGFNHSADSHLDCLPGHYRFIKRMVEHGCNNITVMGTMHEIGYFEGCVKDNTPCNPLSMYGIAKNTLRQACMTLCAKNPIVNLKWLRGFYIIGDDKNNHSIFTKIVEMEEQGKDRFPFNSGKSKYDFISIDELSKQISCAATQNEICGIINVCSGHPVSLKDQVEIFLREHHYKIQPAYGMFQERSYDSPAIWGDATKIQSIMRNEGKG